MRIARETRTEVFRQLQTAVEQSVLDREGYAKEAIQMDKKVKSDELAYRVTLRKYEEGLMSTLMYRQVRIRCWSPRPICFKSD